MKYIFVVLVYLIIAQVSAQSSAVVLSGHEPFQLRINNKQQYKGFKTSIKITGLVASQQYKASVIFKNDSTLSTKLFLLNDGFTHFYAVGKKQIQFKKAVPSIGLGDSTQSIDYVQGELLAAKETAKADSSTKDTAYIVPFTNYYRLEDYSGRIGCPFPIKDEELNQLIDIVNNEDLEDLKLEKVKLAIQDMDSACVLIDQTKKIAQLFDYEETRLGFAKFMYIYTFDIDNYFKLNDVFNFENSRQELKEYVGMQIDKSSKTKKE